MSNKRRRVQGPLPINTIQFHDSIKNGGQVQENDGELFPKRDLKAAGSPKRYREFRKDPKVVDELNHLSSRDFLPLGNDSENTLGDDIKVRNIKNGQDEDLETLEETTPLRRSTRKANGLLFPSPADDETQSEVKCKLLISGALRTVDIKKQMEERRQCLMTFYHDLQGSRIHFTHRNFEIKNSQLELPRDCEMIMFDKDTTCMGMVLRELRSINMGNKSEDESIQTKLLLLMNEMESGDAKINKIKNIITATKGIQIKILDSKSMVFKNLNDIAIHDCKRLVFSKSSDEGMERLKSKKNFLDKKIFSSLGPQKKLSQYASSASHKIPLPKTPLIHDLDETSVSLPNVSAKEFYHSGANSGHSSNAVDESSPSTEKIEKIETESQKDPLENLRRSNRTKSQSPALRQSTLWDLDSEKDFEVPETFRPKLRYKFEDGSSYTITNQDFRCLYNHDWINDSILDFFSKYFVENSIKREIIYRDDVHIMSSFFYTKLVSDPSDYYRNVKKWVNNCDLFRKRYVVVPINNNYHWFGCIITNLNVLYNHFKGLDTVSHPLQANDGKKSDAGFTKADDDEISVSTPIVTILTFDSLRQTHAREIDPIKEFLMAYAKDKYSMEIDKTLIKMKTCMVPQQPNMSDCGVHVILNTKKFFEDPKATMDIWRMTKTRNKQSSRAVNEYFDRAARAGARKDLRNVLWDLQKKQIELMKERNEYVPEEESGIKDDDGDDGDIEIIENFPQKEEEHNQKQAGEQEHLKDPKISVLDEPLLSKSPVNKSTQNSQTPTGALHETNVENSKDDKIGIDRHRIIHHSRHSSPQRHVLESSPIREKPSENGGKSSDGFSSPYFGDSPLKKRAPSFGYKSREPPFPPTHSSFVDTQESDREEGCRASFDSLENSASPVMLTNEMPYGKRVPVATNHYYRERSSPSSFSGRIAVSDLEEDSDVNLMGQSKSEPEDKSDHLIHLQQEFEKELNDNISQTKGNETFLNRPKTRQLRPVLVNSTRNISDHDSYPGSGSFNAVVVAQNNVQAISSEDEK